MKNGRTLEDRLYLISLVFLLVGGIGLIVYFKVIMPYFPPMPCFVWTMCGFYCPGCGGTRAIVSLFQGHLLKSLWYHPLVLYTVVIFGGFVLTQTCERLRLFHIRGWKFREWHLYGALAVLILNFVLKNVLLLLFDITL